MMSTKAGTSQADAKELPIEIHLPPRWLSCRTGISEDEGSAAEDITPGESSERRFLVLPTLLSWLVSYKPLNGIVYTGLYDAGFPFGIA